MKVFIEFTRTVYGELNWFGKIILTPFFILGSPIIFLITLGIKDD